MKLTSRDKLLLIVLPSILILIGYNFFVTKQPMQQLRSLVTRINQVRGKTPDPKEISAQENRIVSLYEQIRTAQQEAEPLRAEVQKLMGSWVDPARRAAASETIARLWGRHNLILHDQDRLPNADPLLSPTLARLVQHARTAMLDAGPTLWQLQLEGSYGNLQAALDEINTSDLPSVPVSLAMTNASQPESILWKLALWQ